MLRLLKKLGIWGIIFYVGYNIIALIVLIFFAPELLTMLLSQAGI